MLYLPNMYAYKPLFAKKNKKNSLKFKWKMLTSAFKALFKHDYLISYNFMHSLHISIVVYDV